MAINGGQHNMMIGNDLYDIVTSHLSTEGGGTMQNLQPSNNIVRNNHITQRYLRRNKWGVRLNGMGDRFTQNLVHDSPGQMIVPRGPLSMIDHNEIFNTGYAEGDGGDGMA